MNEKKIKAVKSVTIFVPNEEPIKFKIGDNVPDLPIGYGIPSGWKCVNAYPSSSLIGTDPLVMKHDFSAVVVVFDSGTFLTFSGFPFILEQLKIQHD